MLSFRSSVSNLSILAARGTLCVLPLLLFPVTLLALFYNYAALILIPQNGLRRTIRRSRRFVPLTVVVTGISTPAGLRTARALYQTGHNVIGIETKYVGVLNPIRWSKAIKKIVTVQSMEKEHVFIEDLLNVVQVHKTDLWIDCWDHYAMQTHAKHVIERRTSCVCLVSDVQIAQHFHNRHETMDYFQSLRLPIPETHRVRSRNDIHTVLNDAKGKKYVLSTTNGSLTNSERAVLPKRTPSQTYQDISQIQISKTKPWYLEQHVDDLQKYSTSSIITRGKVCTFVAYTTSTDGISVLPPTSGLSQAMKKYVEDFASKAGPTFSTHLEIDFCLDEKTSHSGVIQQTLPIGGRLSPSSALVLFSGRKGSIELTRAYTSALGSHVNGLAAFTGLPYDEKPGFVAEPALDVQGVFQSDMSVYIFVLLPVFQLLTLRASLKEVTRSLLSFINQVLFWHDSVYEFWDPLPAFINYLFYTPINVRRWISITPETQISR